MSHLFKVRNNARVRFSALLTALALFGLAASATVAEARPSFRTSSSSVLASGGLWVPLLWEAPAFHASIRFQSARMEAMLEASAGEANDLPPIDWRVLAGLDYLTGKTTDTLQKLNGKSVRVPGFVVPLDDFMEEGAEFLLVPYYGACVHTPPPPPNQIIFVQMAGKKPVKLALFDAVWMHGSLKIETVESPYGTVGFTIEGSKMEPYSSR